MRANKGRQGKGKSNIKWTVLPELKSTAEILVQRL